MSARAEAPLQTEGITFRGHWVAGDEGPEYRGGIFPSQGAARMALRFKLQLVGVTDNDEQVFVDELVVLNKDSERLEHLGLTLAEAKALLLELQRQVLSRQVAAFLAARTPCPNCGRARGLKDHKTILFRTFVRQARAGEPEAAQVSVPARWPGIHEPASGAALRAHCARTAVPGAASGRLWSRTG